MSNITSESVPLRQIAPTRTTRRTRLVSNQNTGTSVNNEYRYGEYFFYAHEYRNHPNYVKSKFQSMIKELTQNKLYPISIQQWNQTKQSAHTFLDHMKKECSSNNLDRQQCFKKFGIHLTARSQPYYNQRFNIKAGEEINIIHLIALKLFFNDGSLSSAIRKTYWSLHEEDHFNAIKDRHSQFVIICQRILEAIYLYGAPLNKSKSVYRGVTQQTFAWFDAKWSGPVSTSLDFRVARRFTGATGSVVKLASSEMNEMYIYGGGAMDINEDETLQKEYSLSDFDEKECLMWAPCLTIIDVPFSRNRKQYDIEQYISAMRLFQKIIAGHLISRKEKQLLLFDDVQNKLHALVEWKLMKSDEKLMECIQYDTSQRNTKLMESQSTEIEEIDAIVGHSRLLQRNEDEKEENEDEKEAVASPHLQTAKFIKSLCGTVFEHLVQSTKMLWTNSDIELEENLDESIHKLFDVHTTRQKCHVLEWILDAEALRNAPYLNEDYLIIDGYLREQLPNDETMANLLVNCDEIMDLIGHYYEDTRCALDVKDDWKCNISYGENNICELNPVIVILPSSFRANNTFYDMEIQIEGDMNTIPGKEHLMWSVDVVCDALDICMHFVDQKVLSFSNRRFTQISGMTNREIQQFVDKKQDIVWKIACRFYYAQIPHQDIQEIDIKQSSIESRSLPDDTAAVHQPNDDILDTTTSKCSVETSPITQHNDSSPEQVDFDACAYLKHTIDDWLRCQLLQHGTHAKKHMISAYGGGGTTNNGNYRKAPDESNNKPNKHNERNDESGSNDNHNNNYNNNYGGSGSNDDDDDKHNDDKAVDDDKDDEETVMNEQELDRFFKLFMNIQNVDDTTLRKQLHSFSNVAKMRNDLSSNIKMLNTGLNRLNNAMHGCKAPNICFPKASFKRKAPKQHKNYHHRAYMPLKTKSKYKWERLFTEELIPQKIIQPLNIGDGAVYEFMVKILGINKDRYYEQDTIRIFNLGLHEQSVKKEVYFIAQRLSSRYYGWKMNAILTKLEIFEKYGISPHLLPVAAAIEGVSEMKEVEQIIMKSSNQIIHETRWTKIPIYNKRDKLHNIRRMTLSLDKPKFIRLYQEYVQKKTNVHTQLIPIVMFGANDAYLVEYVCIVSLEENVDIGIAFEYNKVKKKVKVVGIYLDKEVIMRQHQIINPLHNYTLLDNFKSEITDLYIGNPDDQRNHIKALKGQLEKLQRGAVYKSLK